MSVLVVIFLTAVIALFTGVFDKGKFSRFVAILGLILALGTSFLPECPFFQKYEAMYSYDLSASLFTRIAIVVTLGLLFLAGFAFRNHRSHQSELYALMLFSLCGAVVMFGYQNLVTLFIGIEILSIPLYVMVGSSKTNLRSVEASMKYLLMGAFATGFLLFGVALVYGAAGSFDIQEIAKFSISNAKNKMLIIGVILILIGLAFKVSLAPFHMWSPDVYQGAPSLITAFMASVVKMAAFFAFFKLMAYPFAGVMPSWINVMGILVIITLLLANVMGLAQTNAKRMLAYSSVSHAGYIGMIFFGINEVSAITLAFYLFAYSLSTIGVFMCLIWVEKIKRETSYMAFKGLAKTEPILATVAAVSMLSMAGVPLTAGFMGKFGLFSQAMSAQPFIVLVAVLGSAVSIAYYLRLIIAMFFFKESSFKTSEKVSLVYNVVAVVLVLAIIALGVFPDLFIQQFGV